MWTCKRGHNDNYRINTRGYKECRDCHKIHVKKYNLKTGYHHIIQEVRNRPKRYGAVHQWMHVHGWPKVTCDFCGESGIKNRLEYSNKSGKYLHDLADWQVLCKPCHYAYDKQRNEDVE